MLETNTKEGFCFMSIQVLRVSGTSNINAVSEAIIDYALKGYIVHIDCIGIKASYMTVKALIQTTDFLVKNGYRFNLRPYYIKVETLTEGHDTIAKTAIRWTLIAKKNNFTSCITNPNIVI